MRLAPCLSGTAAGHPLCARGVRVCVVLVWLWWREECVMCGVDGGGGGMCNQCVANP